MISFLANTIEMTRAIRIKNKMSGPQLLVNVSDLARPGENIKYLTLK